MFKLYTQATKKDAVIVREISKKHGIKRCRVSGHSVVIGTQLDLIEKDVAVKLIADLKEAGYESDIQETIDSIVEQNILYSLAVKKFTVCGKYNE